MHAHRGTCKYTHVHMLTCTHEHIHTCTYEQLTDSVGLLLKSPPLRSSLSDTQSLFYTHQELSSSPTKQQKCNKPYQHGLERMDLYSRKSLKQTTRDNRAANHIYTEITLKTNSSVLRVRRLPVTNSPIHPHISCAERIVLSS